MLNKNQYETVITSKSDFSFEPIVELIKHIDLVIILSQRDIRVRYKQTILGVLWVVVQPLAIMSVFSVFFGKISNIPTQSMPYSMFVLIGIIYWNLFSSSLGHISNSLVDNEQILKKVYIPKLVTPISSIGVSVVDFFISYCLFLLISIYFGHIPSINFVLFSIFSTVFTLLASIGYGLFLAALNVKYRDVRYALPFLFQLLLFVSPVIYPTNIVSPLNRIILAVNPISTIIDINRSLLTNSFNIDYPMAVTSMLSVIISLIVGYIYFFNTQRKFADIV